MAAISLMAAIGVWAIGTHRISYVITHGVSMEPVYHAGDLVIVAKSKTYEVGDIAAYYGAGGQVQILHRIIGGNAETGFVFKGDNKESVDGDNPTADQLIGHAVLHVPKGGTWLKPMLSPTGLGMLGFLFVGGAGAAKTRRDLARGRRKKRAKGMSGKGGSWAAATAIIKAVARLHPILRVFAALTALCTAAGLILGVLGWMKPATQSAPNDPRAGESLTFSYSAEVEASAAYDGDVAYSPDPIYRKLADFVNLQLQYLGDPGRISVDARLSSPAGWHTTMQLSQPRQFTAERYTGTVLLDLAGIDERVKAASKAIGVDLGQITIVVTAHVQHAGGVAFEPELSLTLSPAQLSLTNGPGSLLVSGSGPTTGGGIYPRQISVLGRDLMTAAVARSYAIRLLLIALVGIIGIGFAALRSVPLATRAQIQRRYGHLLVPIEPVGKQSEPVVTVASFPALVKLAEKYGQMILTWTRPDGADDFVVRDDGVVYRFRIAPTRPATAKPPLSGMPHPARRAQKSAALDIASVINAPAPSPAPATEPPTPEPATEPAADKAEARQPAPAAAPAAAPEPDKPEPDKPEAPTAAATEPDKPEPGEPEAPTEAATEPDKPEPGEPEAPIAAATEPDTSAATDPDVPGAEIADPKAPEPEAVEPEDSKDEKAEPQIGEAAAQRAAITEAQTPEAPGREEHAPEADAVRKEAAEESALTEEPAGDEKQSPLEETTAEHGEYKVEDEAAGKDEVAEATDASGTAESKVSTELVRLADVERSVAPEESEALAADEVAVPQAATAQEGPAQEGPEKPAIAEDAAREAEGQVVSEAAAPPQTKAPRKTAAKAPRKTASTRAKTARKAATPTAAEAPPAVVAASEPRERAAPAEDATATAAAARATMATGQPVKRSPRRGRKVAPPADQPVNAGTEIRTEGLRAAAPDVPKEDLTEPTADPAAGGEAGPEKAAPRKRAASRKPRARKAATPKADPEPEGNTAAGQTDNAAPAETGASGAPPAETGIAGAGKSAADLAAERQAAEELAERNKALEQAITRKAERDQAAADRARKERLARSAPRDPAYDFLPRNQKPAD
ncbi:signal peptidase I [Actinoplanes octamycinicus]|uniref:Signal peptidase I n=1 Tax=Actinoplanes octamycinicus TaxID=135948 RepID=A0A7W7M6J7_9ACTN|nr:DUF5305 family protein [Actinoplanes octamycinicus]MBB4738873.1 signal peptidase I [Actinoplanes octamycinicus]GIE63189.1 hypothetical protein Aoc01nite_85910 [Actinoplanes octamycinicus]